MRLGKIKLELTAWLDFETREIEIHLSSPGMAGLEMPLESLEEEISERVNYLARKELDMKGITIHHDID